ncbi:MAG TPA: TIM barrel protein [Armatimonadota bacterium]|jgi:sugar phosphate isomerase/epimerase
MRLGGPVFGDQSSPDAWVASLRRHGYTAAYSPLGPDADDEAVRGYVHAAEAAGIVISEVGAWSNPLSPDEGTRRAALLNCQKQLHLADRLGARCCVNIAGSRGSQWDGPDPINLTDDTFDLIVESVRVIIDAVKPTRTYYTLETMPWAYPDSPDSYVRLLRAIDREHFAVHLDPCNLVCSPQRYFRNGDLIRECFEKLGPHIRSCHGKDVLLAGKMTTHIDEVRPGLGGLDYRSFLTCLSSLPDVPLMLEHLSTEAEYSDAADHVRGVAKAAGLSFS